MESLPFLYNLNVNYNDVASNIDYYFLLTIINYYLLSYVQGFEGFLVAKLLYKYFEKILLVIIKTSSTRKNHLMFKIPHRYSASTILQHSRNGFLIKFWVAKP